MTDHRFVGAVLGTGWETNDRRRILRALRGEHQDLPLPLMQEVPGDRFSEYRVVGHVTKVWTDDNGVTWVEGTTSLAPGEYSVAADLVDIEYEFGDGDDLDYVAGTGTLVFTKARLAAVTISTAPAFPDARITVDAAEAGIEGRRVVVSDNPVEGTIHRETNQPDDWDDCKTVVETRRVCEKGTIGCVVHHDG